MTRIFVAVVACGTLLATMIGTASAAPSTLNWGTEVNASECTPSGAPVVNVVEKVLNGVDSGEGGNYWAFSNYTRHIQVWATSTNDEYCAVVQYSGRFYGEEGQTSPGNNEALDGDEDGTFQGGYRATITGSLLESPGWKTRGSVGTVDYDCDIDGNCDGYVDWVAQYFGGGYGFSYEWWGWIYHGGRFGTWVNSIDGNSGDIS
jgi:hypothetical protein